MRLTRRLAPVAIAAAFAACPHPAVLDARQWTYLGIYVAAVAGLLLRSLAPAAVGLVAVAVAAALRCVDSDPGRALGWAIEGFGDATVWIVFGAMVSVLALRKSGLGRRFALRILVLSGARPRPLGFAIAATELLLAPFMPSNAARNGGIVFPLLAELPAFRSDDGEGPPTESVRRLGAYATWTAFASNAITSATFPSALAANGLGLAIAARIVGPGVTAPAYLVAMAPVSIVLLIATPLLACAMLRPPAEDAVALRAAAAARLARLGRWSRMEIATGCAFAAAVVLWVGSGFVAGPTAPGAVGGALNPATVALLLVAALLAAGVLDFDDIASDRRTWGATVFLATFIALADGLGRLGILRVLAAGAAQRVAGLDPPAAMVLLLALAFWIRYLVASINVQAAVVLPAILAAGAAAPPVPATALALLAVGTLGLGGVLTPFASGAAVIHGEAGGLPRIAFWRRGLQFGALNFAVLVAVGVPWVLWRGV